MASYQNIKWCKIKLLKDLNIYAQPKLGQHHCVLSKSSTNETTYKTWVRGIALQCCQAKLLLSFYLILAKQGGHGLHECPKPQVTTAHQE